MQNILCNVPQSIPILVAKVLRQNLDYTKNLQVKYFTGENIQIYSICNSAKIQGPALEPSGPYEFTRYTEQLSVSTLCKLPVA